MGCDNLVRNKIRFIEKTKGAYALVGLTSGKGANSKRERYGEILSNINRNVRSCNSELPYWKGE